MEYITLSELNELYGKTNELLGETKMDIINELLNLLSDGLEITRKTSYLFDYILLAYNPDKNMNIKQDVKKIMKSKSLTLLDIYKLLRLIDEKYINIFRIDISDRKDKIQLNSYYENKENKEYDKLNVASLLILCHRFLLYILKVLPNYRFNLPKLKSTKVYRKGELKELKRSFYKLQLLSIMAEKNDYDMADVNMTLEGELSDEELRNKISNIRYTVETRLNKFENMINEYVHIGNSVTSYTERETVLCLDLLQQLLPEQYDYYSKLIDGENVLVRRIMNEIRDNEFATVVCRDFVKALYKRDYLIPQHGVHIRRNQPEETKYTILPLDYAVNIDIYERNVNGEHYIIVLDLTSDLDITIFNLTTLKVYNTNAGLYDLLNVLMYFYGIEDSMLKHPETDEPILYTTYDSMLCLTKEYVTAKGTSDVYKDFEIEIPYYWRYKGRYKTGAKKDDNSIGLRPSNTVYKLAKIAPFTRRLREGAKPSPEAVAYAKQYCIQLDEGKTLVREFEKKVRVKR